MTPHDDTNRSVTAEIGGQLWEAQTPDGRQLVILVDAGSQPGTVIVLPASLNLNTRIKDWVVLDAAVSTLGLPIVAFPTMMRQMPAGSLDRPMGRISEGAWESIAPVIDPPFDVNPADAMWTARRITDTDMWQDDQQVYRYLNALNDTIDAALSSISESPVYWDLLDELTSIYEPDSDNDDESDFDNVENAYSMLSETVWRCDHAIDEIRQKHFTAQNGQRCACGNTWPCNMAILADTLETAITTAPSVHDTTT